MREEIGIATLLKHDRRLATFVAAVQSSYDSIAFPIAILRYVTSGMHEEITNEILCCCESGKCNLSVSCCHRAIPTAESASLHVSDSCPLQYT